MQSGRLETMRTFLYKPEETCVYFLSHMHLLFACMRNLVQIAGEPLPEPVTITRSSFTLVPIGVTQDCLQLM